MNAPIGITAVALFAAPFVAWGIDLLNQVNFTLANALALPGIINLTTGG